MSCNNSLGLRAAHRAPDRILVLLVLSILAGITPACSDNGPSPDKQVGDLVAHDGCGGDGGSCAIPDSAPREAGPDAAPAARVCGVLEEPSGIKVQGGDVIVCTEHECHTDTAGTTGAFCISLPKPGEFMFHASERRASGKHYGDVVFPVTISATDVANRAKIDVGTVVMPLMGTTVSLDPQQGGTLTLGTGAKLVVPAGATTLPPLKTKADVALAQVELKHVHSRLLASLSGSKTPEVAFLIVPLRVTFSQPISFQLPAPTSLTTGTALEIYAANVETGKLELHGQAKVASTGVITEETGQGLKALSWLLFYKK